MWCPNSVLGQSQAWLSQGMEGALEALGTWVGSSPWGRGRLLMWTSSTLSPGCLSPHSFLLSSRHASHPHQLPRLPRGPQSCCLLLYFYSSWNVLLPHLSPAGSPLTLDIKSRYPNICSPVAFSALTDTKWFFFSESNFFNWKKSRQNTQNIKFKLKLFLNVHISGTDHPPTSELSSFCKTETLSMLNSS